MLLKKTSDIKIHEEVQLIRYFLGWATNPFIRPFYAADKLSLLIENNIWKYFFIPYDFY